MIVVTCWCGSRNDFDTPDTSIAGRGQTRSANHRRLAPEDEEAEEEDSDRDRDRDAACPLSCEYFGRR